MIVGSEPEQRPTSDDSSAPSRRLGLGVLVALLVGMLGAVAVVVVPVLPTRASVLSGAVLLAFALGWLVLVCWSAVLTDRPQWWAAAPASVMIIAAAVAFSGAPRVQLIFSWIWPVALLVTAGWMLVGIRRQLPSRWARRMLYPVIAILALAAIGGGVTAARDALQTKDKTAASELVDVGDHRLYLHCTGSGEPTVILEPGLGGTSADMHWIASAVAGGTRVCVYDRAGRGRSENADGPQDATHVAADLHTLLDRAQVRGPYIVAGHSFGGLYALAFADQFPDELAGLVLLDSTAPRTTTDGDPAGALVDRAAVLAPAVGNLVGGSDLGSYLQEFLAGSASVNEAGAVTDLGDRPLIVVTADTGHDQTWLPAQRRLAGLSTRGQQRVVHATHQSLVDDQETSVAASDAILDVVATLRTGQ